MGQSGFAVSWVILLAVALLIFGIAGFVVYSKQYPRYPEYTSQTITARTFKVKLLYYKDSMATVEYQPARIFEGTDIPESESVRIERKELNRAHDTTVIVTKLRPENYPRNSKECGSDLYESSKEYVLFNATIMGKETSVCGNGNDYSNGHAYTEFNGVWYNITFYSRITDYIDPSIQRSNSIILLNSVVIEA